jgi:4-hydroxyphenylpyruvate dioxygenase
MSKVMSNGNGRIKFPINEPAEGKKKSQIEEYLDFYNGAGVQHMALATDDIVETVTRADATAAWSSSRAPRLLRRRCMDRVGRRSTRTWDVLKRSWGSWWIATTRATCCSSSPSPCRTAPRCSIEIIQRKGAKSFGKGNFKALFEAIEREQALRGNL